MNVGVRELKTQLSKYLGLASAGQTIVVTDRGRPVAKLVPLAEDSAVARGIDEGWIEPARRTALEPTARSTSKTTVMDALTEDRG